MAQTQSKIDNALRINSDAMYERWHMDHSLIASITDSHALQDFATIRCAHTGKPLGIRSAAYLGELQRMLGVEQATLVLKMDAVRYQQSFTRMHIVGETLQQMLLNEPVAFFMHALCEYGGWYKQSEHGSLEEQTERAWRDICKRAAIYDSIRAGLDAREAGSLHMRTLLEACELLRRYLAIAFKHKQREMLDNIVTEFLLCDAIPDSLMQDAVKRIRFTLQELILTVRNQRTKLRNSTNLIAAVRDKYGEGGGLWRAQGRADKYYSTDEASRVLLEAMDFELLPKLSALDTAIMSNRVKRDKAERAATPQYDGAAIMDAATFTIKWS